MERLVRIVNDAGLWFFVLAVTIGMLEPPLSRRAILILATAGLLLGVLKELFVVRTAPRNAEQPK